MTGATLGSLAEAVLPPAVKRDNRRRDKRQKRFRAHVRKKHRR